MKDKLIAAIEKVSEEDLLAATGRWIGMDLNPESMLNNFLSILDEYIVE